jgi:ADP-heptose:LPS heptosyltransferase
LGIRTVALIGPTDPAKTGPYRSATILRHRISCQPCRERSCRKRDCMKLITVDEVYGAVRSAISDGDQAPRVS